MGIHGITGRPCILLLIKIIPGGFLLQACCLGLVLCLQQNASEKCVVAVKPTTGFESEKIPGYQAFQHEPGIIFVQDIVQHLSIQIVKAGRFLKEIHRIGINMGDAFMK